ncbi:Uma2 family endonuclease [Spirulina subsalsa]|uniref:Uma2 family endonuclease n=1 Tax=Spirulina subsalsa TaxID=54311 RepID=UPI0002E30E37|nr:Uma2 family endonuclease [Spirulina subsalsa]
MIATPYKWTLDHYHQAVTAGIFNNQPLELLKGELIVMSPEREPHAYVNSEIGDFLRRCLGDQAKIREAHPITLPNDSEPIPDLAIVRPLGRTYSSRHPYPSDIFWLIEITYSSLNQDLTTKAAIYAEAGIGEYWVVDLNSLQLIVMQQPVNGQYSQPATYTKGTISPLTFPHLEIPVSQLLIL